MRPNPCVAESHSLSFDHTCCYSFSHYTLHDTRQSLTFVSANWTCLRSRSCVESILFPMSSHPLPPFFSPVEKIRRVCLCALGELSENYYANIGISFAKAIHHYVFKLCCKLRYAFKLVYCLRNKRFNKNILELGAFKIEILRRKK